MTDYDVIIIGAGAMGSAAAYHLSKRDGVRVLLLEQFEIDHKNGSSYGNSRIIRYTYKDPEYIRLAKAVYPLWRELEADAGEKLWHVTGGMDFGEPEEKSLVETIQYVKDADIPHEIWTAEQANARFKQFNIPEGFTVLYQADSGMLSPSKIVKAQVRLAKERGADVRDNTPVTGIKADADNVTVTTATDTFTAKYLILTAGSWTNDALGMLGDYRLPLQPLRCQENHFFVADGYDPDQYKVDTMPLYIFHKNLDDGESVYGIPSHDGAGVKASIYGGVEVDHPNDVDRNPDEDMLTYARTMTRKFFPAVADGKLSDSRACLYTMTPDHHFVIDYHPYHDNVVIGAGFSGHGFKFANGIGKILGELAMDGDTSYDIQLWRITRFNGQ